MNAGPIIHPPLIIMNACPLRHYRWDIHEEGTQPATDGSNASRHLHSWTPIGVQNLNAD
jgi:hypothetical protein